MLMDGNLEVGTTLGPSALQTPEDKKQNSSVPRILTLNKMEVPQINV